MNIILLQVKLKLEDIDQLLKEFPQFLFLSLNETGCSALDPDHWSRVEIFFGNKLTHDELTLAHQLKWVHTSSNDNSLINMEDIHKRGNIIVTNTQPSNVSQMGEFVLSGIHAFSKNLFHWMDAAHFPNLIWESKWRDSMWELSKCTLLQIGLGNVGTEVTRRAKDLGIKVWGVQERKTFHPHCQMKFDIKNLHSVLPNVDIVIIALPRGRKYIQWFGKAELELMKHDSVLIVLDNNRVIDEKALAEIVEKDRLRGVMIDSSPSTPFPVTSPLWKKPNVIITPNVAQCPESGQMESFQTFRHNLRQYLYGNFNEMRNQEKSLINTRERHPR